MTRTNLTGLLLAASIMTAGTFAVVNAQEGEEHDHDHTPTTIHAADGSAFELNAEDAYPDPDGFQNMDQRVSYAIGRSDGMQIPMSVPDLDTETYAQGMNIGLAEDNEDYAVGYSQGFDYARRVLGDVPEDMDINAFMQGFSAAVVEEDQGKSIGYLIGNGYREAELPIEVETYIVGILESIALASQPVPAEGEDPVDAPETRLTEDQVRETLMAFQMVMNERDRLQAIETQAEYFETLTEADGWQRTESGLVYKVIQAGEGASPDENDVVTVDYRGALTDGTVFNDSYAAGQPAQFPVGEVIDGWTEILQLMNPGAIYDVAVPFELAYGDQARGQDIAPFSTLRFTIELKSFVDVENEPAAPAPAE